MAGCGRYSEQDNYFVMTIESFFKEIEKLRTKAIEIKNSGVNDIVIKDAIKGLKYKKKQLVKNDEYLLQFIKGYETRFRLISEISFEEDIEDYFEFYFIGWSDIDRLAVLKKTNGRPSGANQIVWTG